MGTVEAVTLRDRHSGKIRFYIPMQLKVIAYGAFLASISSSAIPMPPGTSAGCTMNAVSKKDLDGKIWAMNDARWDDGIVGTNIADRYVTKAAIMEIHVNGLVMGAIPIQTTTPTCSLSKTKNIETRSCTPTSPPE